MPGATVGGRQTRLPVAPGSKRGGRPVAGDPPQRGHDAAQIGDAAPAATYTGGNDAIGPFSRHVAPRRPARGMSADPALTGIGWPPDQAVPRLSAGQRLVRVIEQHRNGFIVHDGQQRLVAQAPRGLVADGNGQRIRPGVGDWAGAEGREPLTLKRLLPRRNALARAAAGGSRQAQLLATNLDLAIVVMGLDGDYNPRRIERYLALIGAAGVPALIVLSKADRSDDAPTRLAEIQALAGAVPVLAINCKDPGQVAAVAALLGPGRTGVLLGSSGAGKSTLSNTLIGEVRQKTSQVRSHDSRGRHTTTVRSLLKLPGGGCLIDSPGMRELALTGEETLDEGQFEDIAQLAGNCRFRDCRHDQEPGCAVRAAIAAGDLDPDRVANWRKLTAERDLAAGAREQGR